MGRHRALRIVGPVAGLVFIGLAIASEPDGWQEAAVAEIARSEYRISRTDDGALSAPNRAHGLRARWSDAGLEVVSRTLGDDETAGGFLLRLRLSAFGRAGTMVPLEPVRPDGEEVRVELRHEGLTEWYVNDDRGLEQGFTIERPPREGASGAPVVLEMSLAGTLRAHPADDGRSVTFRGRKGEAVLQYAGLSVLDATGRDVPARIQVREGRLCILVDDGDAVYPLVVDPIVTSPTWTFESDQAGADLGWSVATAGDVNGDGYSDIVVGASDFDTGVPGGQGKVYGFHGSPSGPPATASWTSNGDNQGTAGFGRAVAAAGDVNGDGYGDVLVGANGYANGQTREGAAYVYLGSPTGLATSYAWRAESNSSNTAVSEMSVASAGDVDGDGYDDVLVGFPYYRNGEFDEGGVFLWLGSASGLGANGDPTNADWSAESNQASAHFGASVATAGDVNGDGFDDVLVGAELYDGPESNEGRAFLWLGSATGLGSDGDPGNADWTADSNQVDGGLGRSVSTAGDVNGDGYADVLLGAWGYDSPDPSEGTVYVYLGSAAGLGASGTPANADWSAQSDEGGAFFGQSVATAGDVNGDGFADVIVGAYASSLGKVFAWFGGPSGLGVSGNPTNADWTVSGGQATSWFGWSVAAAGDVDGDGFGDVLVGAPFYDGPDSNEGRAFLYLGSASGPAALAGWIEGGGQTSGHFGFSVASAGDVNGDGFGDVIVGAYVYDSGLVDEGRAFVYHGSATGLAASPAWSAESDQTGAQLGYSVASAGDVNGDGYSDVVVGALLWDNGTTNEGAAFVWHGSATGLGTTGTPANADWTKEGEQTSLSFGWSVASAGDVNGDGFGDLIVGTPLYDKGATFDGGIAHVYLGSASGLATSASWSPSGTQTLGHFGWSVAGAGDVNGDGYGDVIVGAEGYDNGQTNEGRASVFLGSASGLATSAAWTAESDQADASLGTSVATAGDVNGDGYSDVIVGTPAYDDLGRAFVWLGGASGLGANGIPGNADWFAQSLQADAKLGTSVASAGDVNGDGYGDVVVGAPLWDATLADEGGVFLWMGSASGLGSIGTTSNADWSVTGGVGTPNLGHTVASGGDVNGDGFSDVLTGADGADGFPFILEQGEAYVHYGNGVDGLHVVPQQRRSDGTAPIHLLGKSDDDHGFGLRIRARTPAGRDRVRLAWEVKPFGTAFDGNGLERSASATDTGPVAGGSSVLITESVAGLDSGARYHWRARVLGSSPYFPGSPWLSPAGNARSELDLQTGGFPDLDGDGRQSDADCDDLDETVWSAPGEALGQLFAADKATMTWTPPLDPGGLATALLYDTVRSGSPSDFVTASTCVETNDGPGTSCADASVPAAGAGFFYLVRAENACGVGSLGTRSDGSPRAARTCP